ncbi:unnamed protein product [Bursaphelenchus xylophilus]|uniref:NADH dehydrogenase [ubiquinone] 1 beta subcomplex subunit 4 n=1 Tax=Bursaphelenchus xylophilus TaxID=6326 RepID=A0A1I7RL57_BURXY|nr:unnamed protein product [Bursaphelenchus xylophilus]CAG9083428.1 unnamed protein product [Bursaphelenchus xylophilus]
MRASLRLLKAPNQNIKSPKLWQDPVLGYWESHGKMEFKPGEEYNLTDAEKKAVLWRYRVKEILKKEYLRREYDPYNYKYKEGIVVCPSMFRWYSADMTQAEFFHNSPKSVLLYVGGFLLGFYLFFRMCHMQHEKNNEKCFDGETLWWDRQQARRLFAAGDGDIGQNGTMI